MKIIAIGHYRRVGKDTFANALIKRTHERIPTLRIGKLSWAWKLKQICHELYAWAGLREPEFYETEPGASLREVPLPGINKSPRQIWIDFGTAAVREQVYEDTWLDYVLKNEHPYDVLIIPDTRFLNEASALSAQGSELIKVVRPGFGPGLNRPDQELLGYTGWTNVIGETGQLADLLRWADRYACWLAGGEYPQRSKKEIEHALEIVRPWEDVQPWWEVKV